MDGGHVSHMGTWMCFEREPQGNGQCFLGRPEHQVKIIDGVRHHAHLAPNRVEWFTPTGEDSTMAKGQKNYRVVTSTYDGTTYVEVQGDLLSIDAKDVLHVLTEGRETVALFRQWEYVTEVQA